MGLAVSVGMLADLLQHDPEGAEWTREAITDLNTVLARHRLPAHVEPERFAVELVCHGIMSFPYSFLHYLRRVLTLVRREAAWYGIEALQQKERVTTWILDDTGFLKQGSHSVGVQRQYTVSHRRSASCEVFVGGPDSDTRQVWRSREGGRGGRRPRHEPRSSNSRGAERASSRSRGGPSTFAKPS